MIRPAYGDYLLSDREKYMSFDNKRTSMKAMRTKLKEPSVDIPDQKKPKKAPKVKKLTELNKLANTTQHKELSEFVDQMANTLREFEKMDPSLKSMIRDILTDKPDGSASPRSTSVNRSKQTVKPSSSRDRGLINNIGRMQSEAKPRKESFEIIREVDYTKEYSNTKQINRKETFVVEKKVVLSKSGDKLQHEYKYVMGYHAKWNAVKQFKLVPDASVYFIKGSNLISVQNKINVFVTDGSHRGSLVILYCIMHGIPIIGIDWLEQSAKEGKVLDYDGFRVKLDLDHQIFDRLNISIYKEPSKPKVSSYSGECEVALLEDAVRKFGGVLKSNINEADYLVVIDVYFDRFTGSKARKETALQSIVNYKWIVDCILENFKKNAINPVYEVKSIN